MQNALTNLQLQMQNEMTVRSRGGWCYHEALREGRGVEQLVIGGMVELHLIFLPSPSSAPCYTSANHPQHNK